MLISIYEYFTVFMIHFGKFTVHSAVVECDRISWRSDLVPAAALPSPGGGWHWLPLEVADTDHM